MKLPFSRMQNVVCAVALLAAGRACADELDDRLRAFRDAAQPHIQKLREEAAKAVSGGDQRRQHQAEMLAQVLAQVSATNSGQAEHVTQQLGQYAEYPGLPAELKALLAGLAADLPKLSEQRAERRLAEIERLVKTAGAACLAAKTEADLDPLLRELSDAARDSRGESSSGERGQRADRRLQAATRAVSVWQDHLAHLALGNPEAASTMLQQLLESTEYPIIPRAEIEKRMPKGDAKVDARREHLAALQRVQNVDELEAVVGAMRRAWPPERLGPDGSMIGSFEQLAAARSAKRQGFVAEAFTFVTSGHAAATANLDAAWNAEFIRLRGLVLLDLLPRYLDLRDTSAPKAGESSPDFLLRLMSELVQQRRFADAFRVLEAYQEIAYGNSPEAPSWIAADSTGLRAFAAGERFEAGTLWGEAIGSFHRAAEVGGRFTPSEEAARRAGELSKAHPEEAKASARAAETQAAYDRISRDLSRDATRALESRLPPEFRSRLRPPMFPDR